MSSLKPVTHRAAVYLLLEREDGMTPVFMRTHTKFMPGYYAVASGCLEAGESVEEGLRREVREEIGVELGSITLVHVQYRDAGAGDEWLDFYFHARDWTGEPVCAEPHKHGEIEWCAFDAMKTPLLPYIDAAIKAWRAGKIYSEFKH